MQWQALGKELPATFNAEQAMREGLLGNWNVRKVPEYAFPEDGTRLEVPGRFAVLRDNPQRKGQVDVIGSVGTVYHPIQNEEHIALLDALVDESGSNFVAAGALDNGRRVFVTMKMPGHINVGGVDRVDNYLTALNGHDGSTKFSVATTPIRDACTNVLNMGFMGKPNAYTVRHTKNSTTALVGEARRVLDLSFNYLDSFQQQAERLINTTLTQSQFEEIITAEYGPEEDAGAAARTRAERKVEQIMDLFTEANTQAGIRETAWAGLNALTEWNDHFSPVRGTDRDTTRITKAVLDPSFKNEALRLMARV
jgi:phage/plasmid-like protein (TIGR03299 family)